MAEEALPDPTSLIDVFHPGDGRAPPFLAGRDMEMKKLDRIVERLRNGKGIDQNVILSGPMGNGKTVILKALEQNLRSSNIDVLFTTSSRLANVEQASACLLNFTTSPFMGLLPRWLRDRTIDEAGFSKSQMRAKGTRHADLADILEQRLARRLLKKGRPLAIIVDEAHDLDLDVGRFLFDLSQSLRRDGGSFLLVLAGTPGIKTRLSRMRATFWERSEQMHIGTLDQKAAKDAIRVPLEERGIGVDDEALVHVAENSQRYPFFLQNWGKAICERIAGGERSRVTLPVALATQEEIDALRQVFHGDRLSELAHDGLRDAAIAVAEAFAMPGGWTGRPEKLHIHLMDALCLAEEDALEQMNGLVDRGFVWTPGGRHVEPGIPSLMSYIREVGAEDGLRKGIHPIETVGRPSTGTSEGTAPGAEAEAEQGADVAPALPRHPHRPAKRRARGERPGHP